MRSRFFFVVFALLLAVLAIAAYKPKAGETVIKMSINNKGDIYIKMFPKDSPKTVANFASLVNKGFYNGIKFHRIEPNFVVQAGDPMSKKLPISDPSLGSHGSDTPVTFENNKLTHKTGTIAMALTAPKSNTGDSQFFVNLSDNDFLNGNYCVFGKVVDGMKIVEKLKKGDVITKAVVLKGTAKKK
jgi:cyclophilin family peptidyl-prolyl cis-trans isomerase